MKTTAAAAAAAATSEANRGPEAVVIAVGALEMAARADAAAAAGVEKGKVFVEEEEEEEEGLCRICHLSPDRKAGEAAASELMQIGCGCRSDLGTAHRDCAETWFRVKGNRCCEICGMNAKNITGEEDGSFMEEWHDRRAGSSSAHGNSPERVGCWRGRPFCNFLMACLVMAFILPWFFRVNMF
ncbi:uncharacterized protein M6B38_354170 [Iris pallida]|uniref:RING-CH-type domain-containing protein n=1 Tax=Iris pallida TaxID=29817 RepID=A0AAX6GQ06_IRIPA|nr:uncharacterized protein M6B38_354170 [Iris pallida]